jgi:hypothetical protein
LAPAMLIPKGSNPSPQLLHLAAPLSVFDNRTSRGDCQILACQPHPVS